MIVQNVQIQQNITTYIFSIIPFYSSMFANSKIVYKISIALLVIKWEAKMIKQFWML